MKPTAAYTHTHTYTCTDSTASSAGSQLHNAMSRVALSRAASRHNTCDRTRALRASRSHPLVFQRARCTRALVVACTFVRRYVCPSRSVVRSLVRWLRRGQLRRGDWPTRTGTWNIFRHLSSGCMLRACYKFRDTGDTVPRLLSAT